MELKNAELSEGFSSGLVEKVFGCQIIKILSTIVEIHFKFSIFV